MITMLRSQYLRRLSHLRQSEEGVTLVEAIISTIIFSLAVFTVVPTLTQFQLQAATNESRANAVAISQQILDSIRLIDVQTLPTTGSLTALPNGDLISDISFRNNIYDATVTYCFDSTLCDENTRQIIVQVSQDGKQIYSVETLYTKFE